MYTESNNRNARGVKVLKACPFSVTPFASLGRFENTPCPSWFPARVSTRLAFFCRTSHRLDCRSAPRARKALQLMYNTKKQYYFVWKKDFQSVAGRREDRTIRRLPCTSPSCTDQILTVRSCEADANSWPVLLTSMALMSLS